MTDQEESVLKALYALGAEKAWKIVNANYATLFVTNIEDYDEKTLSACKSEIVAEYDLVLMFGKDGAEC